MKITSIDLILDAKAELGEGPSWDACRKVLYWVDITRFRLHVYNPYTKEHTVFNTGQYIGAVVPRQSGGVVMAMEHGFYAFDFETKKMTLIGTVELDKPNNRFNDGKCDAAGRFWAGTMSHDYTPYAGALYVLDADWTIRKVLDRVTISNGITWNPDSSIMYFIDSMTKKVMAFDYNLATAEMYNPRVVAKFKDESSMPDGMTSDVEGMLWIAVWNGHSLTRWNPNTCALLERINIPATRPTSCVFGGKSLRNLYITSARIGLEESILANEPHAGGLFVMKTNVKGLPTYAFGG
ncbi:SMP-30/gluconolactonase/LRE family protein [Shimazuella sp. AN120528]|uniref:SMP-30/gluconolactonase/LRE family protein n=1 Tax=Shimazuella soli TaxID=1892854 RepID=UPI001F11857C|nr:SMP-30/gluconolactonase/LRE family protein [Shimazuella soli]MCH5584441.1 SMP-30/gluconolactonase/LRE family protein [Shimazuella soli]